jgi:catechol 2,3-dioxygenase-like lactoylglutathione lyase family enzyme
MNPSSSSAIVRVKEIAFTGYAVTDLVRARAFYEGVLGLKTSAVWEHEGKAWVEYDIGPGTIAINNMFSDRWKPSSDGGSVSLEVIDFDEAVQALRAAGVVFYVEPTATGVCNIAVVADPDGNSIAIHQRAAK